jgi:hypothetical protein
MEGKSMPNQLPPGFTLDPPPGNRGGNGRLIEIEAPNGDVVEFPAGTPDSTILTVMRREYGQGNAGSGANLPPGFVLDPPERPDARKGSTQRIEQPGIIERVTDAFTGSSRTDPEFANAPEFGTALEQAARDRGTAGTYTVPGTGALVNSAITPNVQAQIDILRREFPDLETRADTHGNILLRSPSQGVNDWAYLNAPGMSRRDLEEFGVGTLATAPILGAAGTIGSTLLRRALIAAGLMSAGEVGRDVAATAMGSEQGIDPVRATVAGGLGAALTPGVPSAVVAGAGNVIAAPFRGSAANTVRSLVNPEREATRRVGTALARDEATDAAATAAGRPTRNLTDAEYHLAQQTGQPVAIMDTGGEVTRALARSAANVSPEARTTLQGAIDTWFETQADRASSFLAELVGSPANAHATRQAMERARPPTLGPIYDAAYRNGRVGVYTPELAALEASPALQTAMARATQMLEAKQAAGTLQTAARGPTGNPTLEYWDQVQRALRDQISRLRISGAREQARDIEQLRARLMAELDATFPFYGNARATAARFFGAEDALEAGENFATQRFGLDQSRQTVNSMTANERAMFRQGFASRLIENLNNASDRRSVITQLTGSPAARERLEIALGANGARQMEAFMRVEQVMDFARSAVQGNSTTARQLVEMGLGATGAGLTYYDPSSPSGAVAILGAALLYGGRRGDQRVAQRIAEMLIDQDPAVRQRALQQVAYNGRFMAALRAFGDAIPAPARAFAAQQAAGSAGQ